MIKTFKKLDNLTIISIRHALNKYIDEENLITKSLNENQKLNNKLVFDKQFKLNDDIEWMYEMSVKHSLNLYNQDETINKPKSS
jgi:hypothetical protein